MTERGKHPSSLKNLEKGQFRKGQSGNPKGRPPKETCITSILQGKLGQPCDKDTSKTWAEWIALRALELAGENPAYYRELLDRVEGKVLQRQDVTTSATHVSVLVQNEETKDMVERVLAGERTTKES